MLKKIRRQLITNLWAHHQQHNAEIQQINTALLNNNFSTFPLDHLAIIDLPSTKSGITHLTQLFSAIGYLPQGNDYLPSKQNDFCWLTEMDSFGSKAKETLPQIVVADFRLEEMPATIRTIIEKYANKSSASPVTDIQNLVGHAYLGSKKAAAKITEILTTYLTKRCWPAPTIKEFRTVSEFNELLAWVLVFGRKPNHFAYAIHLNKQFESLHHLHHFIKIKAKLDLNQKDGTIKGNASTGIAQGSTLGGMQTIQLADGKISLPGSFIEFVWRYPNKTNPLNWEDYFTGFVAKHANRVIESLYLKDKHQEC